MHTDRYRFICTVVLRRKVTPLCPMSLQGLSLVSTTKHLACSLE